MDDDDDFTELLDQTENAHDSLRLHIGQMQQVTRRGKEFQKVRQFYLTAPEWSTQEGQKFFEMMEHIKCVCESFGEVVEASRKYVLCTRDFAKDTIVFTTEAQGDLEREDERDLLLEWTDSIERMKESNHKADNLTGRFRNVLKELRAAQTEAAGGKARGRENADTATTRAVVSGGGAVTAGVAAGTVAATVGTGGAAIPLLGAGAYICSWATLKFAVDSVRHKEWQEQFSFVFGQLDKVYAILEGLTDDCTQKLNDLSHNSKELLNKYKRMTTRRGNRFPRTEFFKRKCIRLGEESAKLQTACIEYIDNEGVIRGTTRNPAIQDIANPD
ncbi:uncharacterized protein LOC118413216 [Branchiostoma floridae]|uniref:Uncharacterized protein LOC118413216 n=1 Tax=Branchiostoma floridae TaxID=7739 RepID=A0A9J7MLP0_BRAFL|nr:uncharacterized protein LOC118413216 [Branchiostoma floridae]